MKSDIEYFMHTFSTLINEHILFKLMRLMKPVQFISLLLSLFVKIRKGLHSFSSLCIHPL